MSQFYLGIITLAIVIAAVFFILVLIELRTAIKALKEFLQMTESTLKPTLEELQGCLRVSKQVTEDVNTISEDVKVFSGSLREISENVRGVSRSVRFISGLVEAQGAIAAIKISGLRAGIRAASQVVLESFLRRK